MARSLIFCVLLFVSADAIGQEFKGPQSCSACHGQGAASKYARDLCSLDEFGKWETHDKHALAYKRLDTPLAERITKQLGAAKKATENPDCLSCHANWIKGQPSPPKSVLAFGVSCESCHGPSSLYDQPHREQEDSGTQLAWRKRTPADKRKLGMIDVRNPRERARQCFGCHIGNLAEGKFIPHEMYAAGHPPLPSIEIESFCEQMPPHWRTLDEKPQFAFKTEFLLANFPYVKKDAAGQPTPDPTKDLNRSKGVLVGGIMALRESVALFRDVAKSKEHAFPELAVYDCASCHHELRVPSWRQALQSRRLFAGRPGCPFPPLWSATFGAFAARHSELPLNLNDFSHVVMTKPFGEPAWIIESAEKLILQLDTLALTFEQHPFSITDARGLLFSLCDVKPPEFADYHAARQIAWSIRVVYRELVSKSPPLKSEAFEKTLAEIDGELRLALPAGKDVQLTEQLPAALQVQADYDPRRFARQLKSLAETWKAVK